MIFVELNSFILNHSLNFIHLRVFKVQTMTKRIESEFSFLPLTLPLISSCATLLAQQWKQPPTHSSWTSSLQKSVKSSRHYVLVSPENIVIGYIRLKHGAGEISGAKGILSNVIVHNNWRRRGIGRYLLSQAEVVAKRLGMTHLCLCTSPKLANGFYKSCGYEESSSFTTKKKVFRFLRRSKEPDSESSGLAVLQTMLQSKSRKYTESNNLTFSVDDTGKTGDEKVWLQRRISHVFQRKQPTKRTFQEIIDDICSGINFFVKNCSTLKCPPPIAWRIITCLPPHHNQMGPTCGFCAISAVENFYRLSLLRQSYFQTNGEAATIGIWGVIEDIAQYTTSISKSNGSVAKTNSVMTKNDDKMCSSQCSVSPQDMSLSKSSVLLGNIEETLVQTFVQNEKGENENVLSKGMRFGYTMDGEMFNAAHLAHIASFRSEIVQTQVWKNISPIRIISNITKGNLILLPYDSEPGSCLPVLKKGRRSHWCTIVGVALPNVLQRNENRFTFCTSSDPKWKQNLDSIASRNNMYSSLLLITQHSASKRLVTAPFSQFQKSNQQLQKVAGGCRYKLIGENGPELSCMSIVCLGKNK